MSGMVERHVPARVWTLARLAAEQAWAVRVEPGHTCCDVTFDRGDESVEMAWRSVDGKSRLAHVTYAVERIGERTEHDIRLVDVPAILQGA